MLHQLRILSIGLAVVCVASQSLLPLAVSADTRDDSSYQQRREALVHQLESLRAPTVEQKPATAEQLRAREQQLRKEALLAGALSDLIVSQTTAAPPRLSSSRGYAAVAAPEVSFTAVQQIDPRVVAFLQADDVPAAEEPTDDAPDAAAEDAAAEDAAAEDVPPIPPAPRVQTSDQVRDSQESLVRQFRGLIRAVSAGADPLDNASLQAAQAAEAAVPVVAMVDGEPVAEPVAEIAARPAPVRIPSSYVGDPLEQLVDLDFRDADLTNVVAILALKAGINIVAGAELRGSFTANLRQVPLRVAIETALRTNNLGLMEEDGIYFIVPYEDAAAVNRTTALVTLEKADVKQVQSVLKDVIKGIRDEAVISISSDTTSNTLVISAPRTRTDELVSMAHQLDVAEPKLPTVTEAIMLNYSEPRTVLPTIKSMLTPKVGDATGDDRARQIVITDMPVVVEQVKEIIKQLDIPTKQVLIDTMVVDAVLSDEADTGVNWLMSSVRRMSRREAALGPDGRAVGNLQELSLLSDLNVLMKPGSVLNFGLLTGSIDWRGLIQMEVRNRNAHLVSNPVLLTLENEPAEISISQEIPYIELKESQAGGSQTTTSFKEVGTVFTVTPRVTHDNTIITTIEGKESNLAGEFQGIPIEDKREIASTMRMDNGQTIFVGGLRKSAANSTARKIPVLGDVPVINFMFRSNSRAEQINELMVFLTCSVIETDYPELTPYQRETLEKAPPVVPRVDAWETSMYEVVHPEVSKEFQRTWRRGS